MTFQNIGEDTIRTPSSIQTTFNGTNLDQLNGFRTLSVTGRGLVHQRAEAEQIIGIDGAMFHRMSVSPRELRVKALVQANTHSELKELMKQLNRILYSKTPQKISFSDEPYFFYAVFQQVMELVDETRLEYVLTLVFDCYDPFKYTEQKTLQVDSADQLDIDTDYPIKLDEIHMEFATQEQAKNWSLYNIDEGKRIVFRLPQSVSQSENVYIRQHENYIGSGTPQNNFYGIDLTFSDFASLRYNSGQSLVVEPAPLSIHIKYKGRYL